jgi:hypothetical protein
VYAMTATVDERHEIDTKETGRFRSSRTQISNDRNENLETSPYRKKLSIPMDGVSRYVSLPDSHMTATR